MYIESRKYSIVALFNFSYWLGTTSQVYRVIPFKQDVLKHKDAFIFGLDLSRSTCLLIFFLKTYYGAVIYLCICKFVPFWCDIESDAITCTIQCNIPHKENDQNDVRECSRNVDNLQMKY